MTYRGYKILANAQITKFWEIDQDGELGQEVKVSYQTLDDEIWYSVVKDNWCVMSFESIQECKDYIKEISE